MCISIPLNRSTNKRQSRLWRFISATPLNMLLVSVILQFIALFFANVFAQQYWPGLESYSFNLLNFQFWIFPFIAYALLMNFYPRLCQQGEVEYLQYAALNTLGNSNLVFFYIASAYFNSLINIILIFQFLVLIYAFKPIWKIGFWAGKNKAFLVKAVNFSSLLIALSLLLTITGYLFNINFLSSYAPYLSLFQLLVIGLMIVPSLNTRSLMQKIITTPHVKKYQS